MKRKCEGLDAGSNTINLLIEMVIEREKIEKWKQDFNVIQSDGLHPQWKILVDYIFVLIFFFSFYNEPNVVFIY